MKPGAAVTASISVLAFKKEGTFLIAVGFNSDFKLAFLKVHFLSFMYLEFRFSVMEEEVRLKSFTCISAVTILFDKHFLEILTFF